MMRLSSGIVILVIWVVTVSGFCPENCEVIQIPSLPTCNPDTGACSRGCKVGYHGSTCNMVCDANCQPGTCQQRDGSCTCKTGYTFNAGSCDFHEGVSCESNDHCLNNTCRYPGRPDCLKGCRPGWFGKFCQQRCSPHCNCDEVTGVCNTCIPGWYGADCGSACSPGCVKNNCHRNGTCVHGCTTGTYGDQCDLKCSKHCVSGCDQLTGECVQCEAGRYGLICQSECTAGCAGANNDCHRDGRCTKGCESAYYGPYCNVTCEHCKGGDCEQETGECRQTGEKREKMSEVESWVGGSVAVICIIPIAAGLFYMYRRLKRVNGVVYDIVKWRRPSRSAVEDVRPVAAPGYIELEEEASTNPPRVCPIRPTRQTSYIEPRHSDGSRNNLQIQRQLQAVGVADEQEDTIKEADAPPSDNLIHSVQRHPDESHDRPGSYMLPNYCEVNEDLMATPPQPIRGVRAPTAVVMNSSFSDVHTTEVDFNIPLIADCFDPFDTEDSSPDDNQPCVENYDHLFRDSKTQISQATAFGYSQYGDETRNIQPMLHPIITAKPASYIKPRHGGSTVPTQQHLLSDQQEDEPQGAAVSPSDQLLQPAQGAEMAAAVVNNSLSSDVADVHKTEDDIRIPLIAECFGPTEGEDSSPDEDSNKLVEKYDHLFRDHYMEH